MVLLARLAWADDHPEPAVPPHAVVLVTTNASWRVQSTGAPPAAWPYGVDGDARISGAIAFGKGTKVAALHALTTFTLATSDQGLRVLEIRARLHDGCAIWLNGIEVARRQLPLDATRAATLAHGPEWETFYVPVAPGLLRLGENVLAIEVRPTAKRDAPDLVASVVARRELGIRRGPLVAEVGAASATITLDTDAGVPATLTWDGHVVASPPGAHHVFELTGLPKLVRYAITAGAATTPTYALHVAPAAGDTIRIGVYGDARGGHEVHRAIVEAMLREPLDVVAVTGDMVLRGGDDGDWQRFYAIAGPLLAELRYLPALGNHDIGARSIPLPPGPPDRPAGTFWYAVDLADVHLVFLDSNAYDRSEQETWLAADLAAARARHVRAIVAFTHDGPYARGTHRGSALARTRYVPLLAKYKVDLLLAGHDHLYQRGEAGGIRYLVTGGGGAGLYAISCGTARAGSAGPRSAAAGSAQVVDGKPECPDDGMQVVMSEHHYVVLTIGRAGIEACARRPDGGLLEPCQTYAFSR